MKVNWDAIGAVGEILGAAAVLVTLVYLARQIRQNTRSTRSQSRTRILESLNSDIRNLAEDDIWDLGYRVASGETKPGDSGRWTWVCTSWICHLELAYFELLEKNLPEDFEATLQGRLTMLFGVPNFDSAWEENRRLCTEAFQSYVDDLRRQTPMS